MLIGLLACDVRWPLERSLAPLTYRAPPSRAKSATRSRAPGAATPPTREPPATPPSKAAMPGTRSGRCWRASAASFGTPTSTTRPAPASRSNPSPSPTSSAPSSSWRPSNRRHERAPRMMHGASSLTGLTRARAVPRQVKQKPSRRPRSRAWRRRPRGLPRPPPRRLGMPVRGV